MKTKTILIALTALFLCAGIMIAVSKCTEPKPNDNHLAIELLKQRIVDDSLRIIGYKALNASLQSNIKQSDKEIIKERRKRAVIEAKYAEQLARVQHLPDDSAVGLFLDKSDTGEHSILMYDSLYLIPIEPIRAYNDLAVGYDYLAESNQSLIRESLIQSQEIKDLKNVIQNDSVIVSNLENIIKGHNQLNGICVGENERLKKQLRKQKFRTGVAWGVGAVVTYGLLWIMVAGG